LKSFNNRLIANRHHRYQNIIEIVDHPWFQHFNRFIMPKRTAFRVDQRVFHGLLWENLRSKKYSTHRPPLIPKLVDKFDHQYFDDFTDPENMKSYEAIRNREKIAEKNCDPISDIKDSAFFGFDYKQEEEDENYHISIPLPERKNIFQTLFTKNNNK
jgi:hypothetical protein